MKNWQPEISKENCDNNKSVKENVEILCSGLPEAVLD